MSTTTEQDRGEQNIREAIEAEMPNLPTVAELAGPILQPSTGCTTSRIWPGTSRSSTPGRSMPKRSSWGSSTTSLRSSKRPSRVAASNTTTPSPWVPPLDGSS